MPAFCKPRFPEDFRAGRPFFRSVPKTRVCCLSTGHFPTCHYSLPPTGAQNSQKKYFWVRSGCLLGAFRFVLGPSWVRSGFALARETSGKQANFARIKPLRKTSAANRRDLHQRRPNRDRKNGGQKARVNPQIRSANVAVVSPKPSRAKALRTFRRPCPLLPAR